MHKGDRQQALPPSFMSGDPVKGAGSSARPAETANWHLAALSEEAGPGESAGLRLPLIEVEVQPLYDGFTAYLAIPSRLPQFGRVVAKVGDAGLGV